MSGREEAPLGRASSRNRAGYFNPFIVDPFAVEAQTSKAPVALLVIQNSVQEIGSPEIGPQRIGDIQLRIGNLPQQEIADSHITGSPDQQVGIRHASSVEPRDGGP